MRITTAIVAVTSLLLSGFGAAVPVLATTPADYGLTEGDVIRATGDIDIYIVNDWGYKRLFVNPAIFNLYGHLGWDKVQAVSTATRDAFPTSGLFRNCETGDPKVYGLEVVSEDVAVLHWVNTTGAQAVIDDPNFFKKVFCINSAEQALYRVGAPYTSVRQVPDYNRGGLPTSSPAPSSPTPTPYVLQGGAGRLKGVTLLDTLSNEDVGESENGALVLGMKLEADDGSDLRILSVKLSFEHTGAGSPDLDDYASSVSLWFAGKVAEVSVADFDEDADVWSKSITLSGDAVVPRNGTGELFVGVSGNSQIDTLDLSEDWEVTVESIRYIDAQGAVTTDSTTGDLPAMETFTFESFASAADLELKLREASDNPTERSVLVDENSSTDNIVLLSATLQAVGGDVTVKGMRFTVTPDGTGDASEIAESFKLVIGGVVVETIDSSGCTVPGDCDGTGTNTAVIYEFNDFEKTVDMGTTVTLRFLADIRALDGTVFAEGDNLKVDVDNDDTAAEDFTGEALETDSELKGAATGEFQEFYTEGPVFSLISTSASSTTSDGAPDTGTFVIRFRGTSTGTNSFIQENCTNNGGDGIDFEIIGVGTYSTCNVSSTADDDGPNGNFEIADGSSEEFTLTVVVLGANGFVNVGLQGIDWASTDIANPATVYDVGMNDYRTNTLFLSSN